MRMLKQCSKQCSSLIMALGLLSLSLAPAGHALLLEDPIELGSIDAQGSAQSVSVDGELAYVADATSGLRVIDVSDRLTPVEVGSILTGGAALSVSVVGARAYVADRSGARTCRREGAASLRLEGLEIAPVWRDLGLLIGRSET